MWDYLTFRSFVLIFLIYNNVYDVGNVVKFD